jgi:hypothetical protein
MNKLFLITFTLYKNKNSVIVKAISSASAKKKLYALNDDILIESVSYLKG